MQRFRLGIGQWLCAYHHSRIRHVPSWKESLDMAGRLFRIEDWERLAEIAAFEPTVLASLCLVSDRQLQRHFREQFHTTPALWLRKLQCSRARELIVQGYTTKAAAAQVNFASNSHFCREFKKHFGVSPQAFSPTLANKAKWSLIDKRVGVGPR